MPSVRRLLLAVCLLGLAVCPLPAANVLTNTAANLVLGQSLFTTNASASPANALSLNVPSSVAIDPVGGKVFVADQANNRVLRYANQASLKNGAPPDLVIGQLNYSSSSVNQGGSATQTSLSAPSDVFVDANGRLWIADTGNNRVLLFENAANISTPAYADRVYGQPDFTTATSATTAGKLSGPAGVCVDPAGTLWVADTGNNRVLAFKNAVNLANGAPADRVLGQTTFATSTAATTQNQFISPVSVSANASFLWVADRGSNRVLEFPNYPTINGQNAGLVLGQKDYISTTPGNSATGLTAPSSVFVSGSDVWVADAGNNRVLRFANTAALTKGAAASAVVGQANFTTGSTGLSAKNLALFNSQIWIDPANALWVADTLNNRALRFPTTSLIPTVTVTSSKSFTTKKTKITIRGTAADDTAVRRVSYELGNGPFHRTTITSSTGKNVTWVATFSVPLGKTRITIQSVNVNEQASAKAFVTVIRK